jgi:hypothetical protein
LARNRRDAGTSAPCSVTPTGLRSSQDRKPMAPLKTKGDLAELKVACDLVERAYRVAIPFGEDCDFDLVAWKQADSLERFQVKSEHNPPAVLSRRATAKSSAFGMPRTIGIPSNALRASRWSQRDSNPRPRGCKPRALPTELWPQAADCTAALPDRSDRAVDERRVGCADVLVAVSADVLARHLDRRRVVPGVGREATEVEPAVRARQGGIRGYGIQSLTE